MTVCIVAACDAAVDGEAKIIVCSDTMMSGALGKSQTMLKLRIIANGWNMSVAGSDDEINAMVRIIRTKTTKHEQISGNDMLNCVRESLAELKREKSDEWAFARFGLSYDELLKRGKSQFPDDVYREAVAAIRDLKIEAEFIVSGFDNGFPFLIETDTNGKARVRDDFAIIGAGASLALSVMLQREHSDIHQYGRALYAAYEAKRYAEGHISVGDVTSLVTIDSNGERVRASIETMKWLKDQFAKYGPKELPREMALPPEALVRQED